MVTGTGSGYHAELGASKMVLEQPVAEVDCKVDLVGLADFYEVATLVHVDRHKVIADFGSVLCGMDETEIDLLSIIDFRMFFFYDLLALNVLLPANLVETLSK